MAGDYVCSLSIHCFVNGVVFLLIQYVHHHYDQKFDHTSVGVNAPTQTEDPDNQMDDITKGEVSTGWDVCTVWFLFVHVCVVAWQDSPLPEHLNNKFVLPSRS
jgi:hypothetical protein